MILYRPHRGNFEDSIKETKEFQSIDEMFNYIVNSNNNAFQKEDIVIKTDSIFDSRCGWNCRNACVNRYFDQNYIKMYGNPQCIGICDIGELNREKEKPYDN